MSFWINERLGIAYESTEGGLAKWNSEDDDFTSSFSLEERKSLRPIIGSRSCTCDEAKAFMRSKSATKGSASEPRA